MQSLFGGGGKELLGLDISSSSVKLLELSRRGQRFQVEAYAIEPLPANAVSDKQISDPGLVGESILRAINRSGTRTKNVAVGVAGASVITKIIQLTGNLSESDMEEQIKAQADQYIPYPIEEVNLDFQVLGDSDHQPRSADVLLAACRKEQVESRCAAVELAGLNPKVVDIEAYALENSCQFLQYQMPDRGADKTVAIVDMGANSTSLIVLHDMQTIYTRDQAFGGKQLTEEIMRQFGVSFEEAGKAKKFGNLPENYESEVLPTFVSDMAQQIDRSLQFFFAASGKHSTIDQIILGGGCSQIPGADQAIAERLQIPTVLAKPFASMTVAAKARPSALATDESAMLIAAGLAFRAFDAES